MNKVIKNLLIVFLMIIFIPLLTSCGAGGNSGDVQGIPFKTGISFIYQNETYCIYVVADNNLFSLDFKKNKSLLYNYKKYENNDVSQWTINYIDTYEYIQTSELNDDLLNEINNYIKPYINEYSNLLNISLDTYSQKTNIEKEYTIENNSTYDAIYIIDIYIPFMILNESTFEKILIEVPVKTIIGYESNGMIMLDFGNELIVKLLIYDFINSQTVLQK